jgi:hypothetical protein
VVTITSNISAFACAHVRVRVSELGAGLSIGVDRLMPGGERFSAISGVAGPHTVRDAAEAGPRRWSRAARQAFGQANTPKQYAHTTRVIANGDDATGPHPAREPA